MIGKGDPMRLLQVRAERPRSHRAPRRPQPVQRRLSSSGARPDPTAARTAVRLEVRDPLGRLDDRPTGRGPVQCRALRTHRAAPPQRRELQRCRADHGRGHLGEATLLTYGANVTGDVRWRAD